MGKITFLGDVHGKHEKYLELTKKYENTIQLGDFGFNYDVLNQVDHQHHMLYSGNHDNVTLLRSYPHWLGSFGMRSFWGHKFFFVSGANSIDKGSRVPYVSWWPDEELSSDQMGECLYEYGLAKPEIVLSHDCPDTVCMAMMGDNRFPSNTGKLLEMMFQIHQPKLWIFGHMHRNWEQTILNTKFVCLNELETFTLE